MKTKNASGSVNWIYENLISETPQDYKFLLCVTEYGQLTIMSWEEENNYRRAEEIRPASLFYDVMDVLKRHSLFSLMERKNIQGKLDFGDE
ncbi:MAG: nuclear telomere cap complex subunit Ten1 [Ignavibacteria bacterium]|nr:nuclear telomere cap complex subunit Ten1 [Ignavibacteria bacterium]